jgi:hypothetical protein
MINQVGKVREAETINFPNPPVAILLLLLDRVWAGRSMVLTDVVFYSSFNWRLSVLTVMIRGRCNQFGKYSQKCQLRVNPIQCQFRFTLLLQAVLYGP